MTLFLCVALFYFIPSDYVQEWDYTVSQCEVLKLSKWRYIVFQKGSIHFIEPNISVIYGNHITPALEMLF